MAENKFMEHPTYEELLSHLEASDHGESKKKVKQHLENCAQCAAELAGWQRTIQKLQSCDLPSAEPVRAAHRGAWLNWAAAAAFVLSIGFALGRTSQPSVNRLKHEIITQVRPQLQQELRAEFLAALGAADSMPTNFFQEPLQRELISTLAASEKQHLVQEVLQVLQQKQNENQRTILALLNQVRTEHESDYLSLRQDLETAASVADNDLRQNRQRLSQLAATLLAKNQE